MLLASKQDSASNRGEAVKGSLLVAVLGRGPLLLLQGDLHLLAALRLGLPLPLHHLLQLLLAHLLHSTSVIP